MKFATTLIQKERTDIVPKKTLDILTSNGFYGTPLGPHRQPGMRAKIELEDNTTDWKLAEDFLLYLSMHSKEILECYFIDFEILLIAKENELSVSVDLPSSILHLIDHFCVGVGFSVGVAAN